MNSKNLDLITDNFVVQNQVEEKTLIFIILSESEFILNKVWTMLRHYNFLEIEIPHSTEKNEIKL